MKQSKLLDLFDALDIKSVRRAGRYLTGSCPFAPYTHDGGTDSHPSWGVAIEDDGPSRHSCFTCGVHGSLYELVIELRRWVKTQGTQKALNFKKAMEVALQDNEDTLLDDWDEENDDKVKVFTLFPEVWLQSFPVAYTHPYLAQRGVPPELARAMDVRYDFQTSRVCFPIRDHYGRLAGMQGRDVTGKSDLRYLTYRYHGKVNPDVWLGEEVVNWDDVLILTEGPFDYARGRLVTDQMLASLTSALNDRKLERLSKAPMLVSLYDYGTGGNKAREHLSSWAVRHGKEIVHIVPDKEYGDLGATPVKEVEKLLVAFL
jgi:hypothetical protein